MLKALRGTKDILPADVGVWQHIESSCRYIFAIYGYKEIRTPVIEEAKLFIRSIGDGTDIVQKEMYVFSDRGGRTIALRPEGTASIARAYIENSLGEKQNVKKLFYIGPMFRSERPQKGRQRQFHQLGVEAIGSDSPFLDVEVISLAIRFLEKLGLDDFSLNINSLGCNKDKLRIIEGCKKDLKPCLRSLCGECRERYDKNVLRIFDCKNPECRKAIKDIEPKSLLCADCREHFESVKKGLKNLGIRYTVDLTIVRGLDYYTKTVFEVTQKDLGSKDAVCAGGRYNNLIEDMGGGDTPSVGFAFGIERLALVVKEDLIGSSAPLNFFIVTTGESLYEKAFILMMNLRDRGCSCDIEYERKSLKAQMRKAQKLGARFVVIFGEEEFRRKKIVFKDMVSGDQEECDCDNEIIFHKVDAILRQSNI